MNNTLMGIHKHISCIKCFLDSEFQRNLKTSTFTFDRFEKRLEEYKNIYISEIQKLVPVDKCSCRKYTNSTGFIEWTNSMLKILTGSTMIIEEIFDAFLKIYKLYITKSYKHSADLFWNTVTLYDLIGDTKNLLGFNKLFFRARNDECDTKDPKSFLHIPFNMRGNVGNQRFSISGQPMLYLGTSIYPLSKELCLKNTDSMNYAAFLPRRDSFYRLKINEVDNYYSDYFNNTPALFDICFKMPLDSRLYLKNIRRSIMGELLTFPRKSNGGIFVEEYVLPQIFTSLLIEDGYDGIIYPSTKDYSSVKNHHRFTTYNKNMALFTKYNNAEDYDPYIHNDLFEVFVFDGSEQLTSTVDAILAEFKKTIELHKKYSDRVDNSYCIDLICSSKLHLEYLNNAEINGIKYFDTREGKIELEFLLKMSKKIYQDIDDNIKKVTGYNL